MEKHCYLARGSRGVFYFSIWKLDYYEKDINSFSATFWANFRRKSRFWSNKICLHASLVYCYYFDLYLAHIGQTGLAPLGGFIYKLRLWKQGRIKYSKIFWTENRLPSWSDWLCWRTRAGFSNCLLKIQAADYLEHFLKNCFYGLQEWGSYNEGEPLSRPKNLPVL